jgi:hypothetical protein
LAYGITPDLSVDGTLAFYQSDFDDPRPGQSAFDPNAVGLGDLDLTFKYRFFKEDLGPVDTLRAAFFAGTELPTATEGFGSASADPQAGAVVTAILGRHGINQSVAWRFTTAGVDQPLFAGDTTADVFAFNTAYLFRLAPEEFGSEHTGAWYLTAEANGTAETNGDVEVLFSPGILYEGVRWAFEATVSVPIVQEVTDRAEVSFSAMVGFRVLF